MCAPRLQPYKIYQNARGTKFYRLLPDRYPDPEYDWWYLWQPIKLVRLFGIHLFWRDSGKRFWLDSDGFYLQEK